ncbi:hypothetical protein SAMN05421749_103281 [Acinetobacter marinus]|uniref:Uncharacterized protein n=1 Tax=Acinetobacter marinus TaxID=281375 RepID=A0A1G6J917_9GAMM|nr:hypothetical protein [Acinetobacter marinus]SDC15288.1 hypothetical protein SAMN05421749_103281 [Acinetobacter marinus]
MNDQSTHIQIFVPLAFLKSAVMCAGDFDLDNTQPFRNEHVHFRDGHIVATNEHMMFYAPIKGLATDVKFSIPKIDVKQFIERAERQNLSAHKMISIHYNDAVKNGFLEVKKHLHCEVHFHDHLQLDKFNWQNPVELSNQVVDNDYPHFQAKYIQVIEDISKLFGTFCSSEITPTGARNPAKVDFLYSEMESPAYVLIMPRLHHSDSNKYCVEVYESPDDTEPTECDPAESLHHAINAVIRMRKDVKANLTLTADHASTCIQVARWTGDAESHHRDMFYNDAWFAEPLRDYKSLEGIREFIEKTGDIVGCIGADGATTIARTVEEAELFFAEHGEAGVTS